MKNKNMWLLILTLALTGGTILVDRFVCAVPDWAVLGCFALAVICNVAFLVVNKRPKK